MERLMMGDFMWLSRRSFSSTHEKAIRAAARSLLSENGGKKPRCAGNLVKVVGLGVLLMAVIHVVPSRGYWLAHKELWVAQGEWFLPARGQRSRRRQTRTCNVSATHTMLTAVNLTRIHSRGRSDPAQHLWKRWSKLQEGSSTPLYVESAYGDRADPLIPYARPQAGPPSASEATGLETHRLLKSLRRRAAFGGPDNPLDGDLLVVDEGAAAGDRPPPIPSSRGCH